MTNEADQEFLRSVFLMEAWDTVAAIEEGLARLLVLGAWQGVQDLVVVTHRLKGAAALHGFPRVAGVAGAMEQILDRALEAPPEKPRSVIDELSTLTVLLKTILDGIGTSGTESSAEAIPVAAAECAAAPSPPAVEPQVPLSAPAELGSADPPAPPLPWRSVSPDTTADGFLEELHRFFAESADILTYFGPEAAEHLEAMDRSLLALERLGRSEGELATLFRAVHTLKGAAYTVGFQAVADLTHRTEDLLEAIREDRIALGPAVIESLFASADALRLLLGSAAGPPPDLSAVVARAALGLASQMRTAEAPVPEASRVPEVPQVSASALDSAHVDVPERGAFGTVRPGARRLVEPQPADQPETPARTDREVATPAAVRSTIRVNLDRLDSLMNLVGELVTARSRLDRRLMRLDRVDDLLNFSRVRLAQAVTDFEKKHAFTQFPMPGAANRGGGPSTSASPREDGAPLSELFNPLEFDRYDDFNILARSVGEISADVAEVQAELGNVIDAIRDDTATIQRLTRGVRNEITRTRMVPIGQLFARFARQVREIAKSAGKTVALEVSGESVELDNAIFEQIADPLLHLVTNAISHGIESEAERAAQAKSPHGTVSVSAHHRGGSIYIEVEDDGRGIDVEALKAQAVTQGFIGADAAARLSEREALNLIFLPGFSTAETVTTAAGRGVGMDVVRTNVSRLSGEVDVETEVGVGTRFGIKLPLTVAISEALMVRVGPETFAIPIAAVKVILTLRRDGIQIVGRSEMVRVDDELVDLVRMDRVLDLPASPVGQRVPVVVLHAAGTSFAIALDELLGKEEIVIKSLGGFLEGAGPFGGATISGEGRVILLLDPAKLLAESQDDGRDGARGADRLGVSPAATLSARTPPVSPMLDIRRRVLLADDSISVRRFVGQMLEKAGFHVVTASDGAEALERLAEIAVDVVVTDLEMPRVNGYELIEDLHRRPSTRDVPVVVLTSRAGEKHVSLARRLGVKHYVTKPVDDYTLVRLLHSITVQADSDAELTGASR